MFGRWRRAFLRGVCNRRGHVWYPAAAVDWVAALRQRCQRCGARNGVQAINVWIPETTNALNDVPLRYIPAGEAP